jgi:uncharacterized NAD-dependent epimerase/dehydratase family protein
VASVIDSRYEGQDAGTVLDNREAGIPVCRNVRSAVDDAAKRRIAVTHFVIGLAPETGRLPGKFRPDVIQAINSGLNIDSGLHEFLSEDRELARLADKRGVRLRDVRKPPARDKLHAFTGQIDQVACPRLAVLGTDSAVGKRTTAWLLVDALRTAGYRTELIGTSETAWMQGAQYGIVMPGLVRDFVAGELEHAVLKAWEQEKPELLVIESHGSLMSPVSQGGLEILAVTRPDAIVLQHAPTRQGYYGLPTCPIRPLLQQIQAIELLADKPVVAITVNHEGLQEDQIQPTLERLTAETGRPAYDVLRGGVEALAATVIQRVGLAKPQ